MFIWSKINNKIQNNILYQAYCGSIMQTKCKPLRACRILNPQHSPTPESRFAPLYLVFHVWGLSGIHLFSINWFLRYMISYQTKYFEIYKLFSLSKMFVTLLQELLNTADGNLVLKHYDVLSNCGSFTCYFTSSSE